MVSNDHEHEWVKQERGPPDIGISYYYYQCSDPKCSMVSYPMKELQKLFDYSKDHQFLFLEDWIFILFYALKDSPIAGRTSLQKQVFLMMVEFAQKENIPTENIGFYGYKYGPYDDRIADALECMIDDGFVIKNGRKGSSKETLYLTEEGIDRAKKSFDKLTEEQKTKVIESRKEYQMWGREGLLKYVYSNYDEYTHESNVRNTVLNLRSKK